MTGRRVVFRFCNNISGFSNEICVFRYIGIYTFLRKLQFRSIIDLELSSIHGKLRFEKSEWKIWKTIGPRLGGKICNLRISVHIGIFMYWSIYRSWQLLTPTCKSRPDSANFYIYIYRYSKILTAILFHNVHILLSKFSLFERKKDYENKRKKNLRMYIHM